jgi:hypothetical protein
MSNSPQSSEEKLRDLANAIDGLERKTAPPPPPVKTERLPKTELGPKTKLAVQIMAWGFRVFWGLWIVLALIVTPPRQISDLFVVPFSAFVCWLIFQFDKAILVAAVRKISGSR